MTRSLRVLGVLLTAALLLANACSRTTQPSAPTPDGGSGPAIAAADSGSATVEDAGSSPSVDAAAVLPEDDGGVRPRSDVVIVEWFSTGGGPRQPAEGGFDISQRVFADGRYEMRSDSSLETTSDMRFVPKKVPKIYRPSYQLTRVEMAELEALVRRTVSALAPRYEERSTDRGSYRFVFRIDGKEYKSELVGHLREGPLAEFTTEFPKIHKDRKKRTQSIRAWTKSGAVVSREVGCDLSGIDALRPLTHTMFPHGGAKAARPPASIPPPATVLIQVKYFEDGKLTDDYRVTADGTVKSTTESGATRHDARLTPEETQALVVTLEDIDWSAPLTCK